MMQVVKILVANNYRAYELIVRLRQSCLTTDEVLPHTNIDGKLTGKA